MIEILERIKNKAFDFTPDMKQEITSFVLQNIGAKDSYLRDDLIYECFSSLLFAGVYSKTELSDIIVRLTDEEHLFYRISSSDNAWTLTRSFSILSLATILAYDFEKKVLNAIDVKKIQQSLICYLSLEQDYTGYHDEYGWIHAIAHSSDCAVNLIVNDKTTDEDCFELLKCFSRFICQGDYVFVDREFDRMAVAFAAYLKEPKCNKKACHDLISGLKPSLTGNDGHRALKERVNMENFYKALYFCLVGEKIEEELRGEIAAILTK